MEIVSDILAIGFSLIAVVIFLELAIILLILAIKCFKED